MDKIATITLIPENQEAKDAFLAHIKGTSIKDRLMMRSVGVRQSISTACEIIISFDNFAFKTLRDNNPGELRRIIEKELVKLTDDIKQKFNIIKGEDYTAVIEL